MKPSLRDLAGMLVLASTVVWFGGSAWATNLPDTWSPLKQALFGDRQLQEGMIRLEAPEVAEETPRSFLCRSRSMQPSRRNGL